MIKEKTIEEKVLDVLSQVRPYLVADGGDVQLVEITQDLVVRLEFQGACTSCPMSRMTFTAGIENAILQSLPEVKRVELV